MLNLVVLDVLDHSGQLHSRVSEELRHRHSGYPVVLQGEAAVMVEITFPLPPSSLSFSALLLHHHRTTTPPSSYFAASISLPFREPRLHPPREPTESDFSSWSFSYRRALGNLRAPGDIRNTVAIILPFDLTSCTSLEPTSSRYDPAPSYARIRTPLSTI